MFLSKRLFNKTDEYSDSEPLIKTSAMTKPNLPENNNNFDMKNLNLAYSEIETLTSWVDTYDF